ncbi:MAG: hypothetical protein B0A82_01055 [Alkalinema sp. CACIAM 70d]|nr:MAG: hypothetical protein B0A82_01055 [Alkalinema sp. CACIAM 70d]
MLSGAGSNLAYNTLLNDYIKYHAVFFIEGSIFTILLAVLSVHFWWRFKKLRDIEARNWTFEKKVYFCFGLLSTIVALGMLVIVLANLSSLFNPQEGFAQLIPDLSTQKVGIQKAVLYQAVNTWVQSGSAPIPTVLQNEVQNRLLWQRPKAIVCSLFLAIFAMFTAYLWQELISLRASNSIWRLKEKALLTMGIIALPVTLLLMVMALANTQASFAPITLTLLFS